jgi:hypothetical protein
MEQEITIRTDIGTTFVTDSMRLKRRDGLWLAMAVLLHAILLLVPLRHIPSVTEISQVVSVSLLAPRKKQPVVEPQEIAVTPPGESRPAESHPPRALPPNENPAPVKPEAGVFGPDDPPVNTTTARLIDSATRFKWPAMEKDQSRQLGVFMPQAIPDNWRPGITVEDYWFNGMVVPAKTDIVDRWLAVDGSHNVVLNTTSNETLCGRAQPWDPMRPMLEPVMTFWKCGGGGKRAFKMPDRYMRSRQDRALEGSGDIR